MKKLCVYYSILSVLILISGIDSSAAREVRVRRGESLSLIAARELGDMSRWEEIARLNNIVNPKKLQEGTVIILPSEDGAVSEISSSHISVSSVPHIPGVPSARRISGAIRYRMNELSQWKDLTGNAEVTSGFQIMTANTGSAEIKINDNIIEVGNFSILKLDSIDEKLSMQLILGRINVRSSGIDVRLASGENIVSGFDCEFKANLDDAGTLKISCLSGEMKITNQSGRAVTLAPGFQAVIKKGGTPELKELVSPIKLISPADGFNTEEENIVFQWTTVQRAKGYRFELSSDDQSLPKLIEQTVEPKIQVNKIPEGRFTWNVTPLGIPDTIRSKTFSLTVDRSAPPLKLNPPRSEGGEWIISGITSSNALVRLGAETINANQSGAFSFRRRLTGGILIAGVEARTRANGKPSRAALSVSGRPDGLRVPVTVEIPTGSVLINDFQASSFVEISEGMNNLSWRWEDESGKGIAGGSLRLYVDMTPPEILAVRSEPSKILSGDKITIYVKARDKGTGLADVSSAKMNVAGPGNFTLEVTAENLSEDGEYVFSFNTPKNLGSGYIRVTQLDISDKDGNAIILSSEGMATETADPRERMHKFFSHALMLGVGILIGGL